MTGMKGGEIIAEYLVKEGVPYVFTLCGHGDVGMLDALYDRQDRIRTLGVRVEQTAGFMADGFFRIAHRPVATLTSCGPGSCNLPIALASAYMDSSALLAITGNVPTSQFNRGPFQETYRHFQAEFPAVVRPYVKRSFQPTRVEMLPLALRQAFAIMLSGRPGPVHLDVPLDLFQEEADGVEMPEPEAWRKGISSRSAGDPEAVVRAVDLLLGAVRPLVHVGNGVALAEGEEELRTLLRRLQLPLIHTPNGAGLLPASDPLYLGFIGRNGPYPANQAGRSCDALLAVGVRFDDRSSSSWVPGYSFTIPPTRLIQVDIDPSEIGRNYPVAVGIVGDARSVLRQILAELDQRGPTQPEQTAGWRTEIARWKAEWEAFVAPQVHADAVPIHPARLVHDLQEVIPEDAIVACDVGVHHNWMVQFWRAERPRTLLNSWGFASMGFGVCGILGAKLAAPERTCMSVCGDGGFMMMPHVLCTAVEYDIPAIWVIWNNYAWAAIRDIQVGLFRGRELATAFRREATGERYNPDFVALARACGADGIRVERPADLKPALEHALRSGRPFVLDVVVDADVRPPSTGTWALPPLPHPEPAYPPRGQRREG